MIELFKNQVFFTPNHNLLCNITVKYNFSVKEPNVIGKKKFNVRKNLVVSYLC